MSESHRTAFSDWDLELEFGENGEHWVRDFIGDNTVEVKSSRYFLQPDTRYGGRQLAFIEFACRGRDGKWRDSGIRTTKARGWVIRFGDLPGGLLVDVAWLRRAYRLAFERGQFQRNDKEPNPTRGVLVGLDELWQTRP